MAARPHAREVLHEANYQRRMAGLRAVRRDDKRSSRGQVFWSPTTRSWILAYRTPPNVTIEFYADCPCGT
jgi:hypothetical protein